jgi:NADPH:quinone reductase-like Zn-dependent oxidoreductase
LLISISATAFNPIDYQIRRGASESKLLKSPILGRELSGIVVETGSKVTGFSTGDAVSAYVGSLASNGTYAQYISIPQQLAAKKPPGLSFATAAAVSMVGLTALQCVERLKIDKDTSVFIAGGAGGVGTFLIKLLYAKGLRQMFTTAGSKASREHLNSLGLPDPQIIDYRKDSWPREVLEANENALFDVCIDLVGGAVAEICSEILKTNGTYADIANLAGDKARETFFDKGILQLNISNYAYALSGLAEDYRYYGEKLQQLLQLLETQYISEPDIMIVGDFGLETVAK